MRLGYADPPYYGCGKLYAEHHPNALDWDDQIEHEQLVKTLESNFDGWVLHLSATPASVALYSRLVEGIDGARWCSWVKGFAAFKKNVSVAYCIARSAWRGAGAHFRRGQRLMAGKSNIEWTGHTWNPFAGCAVLSPGCTNCYAMKMAARLDAMGQPLYKGLTKPSNAGPVWRGTVRASPHALLAPLRRKTPTTYFVNSMSDLFYEVFDDSLIDQVFAVMALCPQHTFQVLTKRAERMRNYFVRLEEPGSPRYEIQHQAYCLLLDLHGDDAKDMASRALEAVTPWPLPNVWLGVSTERQKEYDERWPHLASTPAAVRFISYEPALGPLNLQSMALTLDHPIKMFPDWVICGGESGPDARPMHPSWARALRDQCALIGVPFFFKQWGAWAPSTPEQAAGNPRSGWCTLREHPRVAKAEELYPETGAAFIEHFGKKAAGRLLDGVTHDDMPLVSQESSKP